MQGRYKTKVVYLAQNMRESQEALGCWIARERAGNVVRWQEREKLHHLAYSCMDFTLEEPHATSSLDSQ